MTQVFLSCMLAISLGALSAQTSPQPPLQLASAVDLPGITGDVDHMALDVQGQRLFLAAEDNGTVRVINLKTGKLDQTVKGFETPHSLLYLPEKNELLVTDGTKAVHVLDAKTFKAKKEIPTEPGADSIGFDARNHVLYTITGGKDVKMPRSFLTAIDLKSESTKSEMPIDAIHVEAMTMETNGPRLFVNVTDKGYLAVVDRHAGKLIAQWPIKEARVNAPIAFDEQTHRLFIVCRDPGVLVVLNSDTGETITSFPTGKVADEVVFDPVHKRIYVASGEGSVFPYVERDANTFEALTPVPSEKGGKTAMLSPDAAELFVAVSPGEGKEGAKILRFKVN